MHRDTKVGLALGVLLVGVVAAFFFRHETAPALDVPALRDAGQLDAAVAERAAAPYLPDPGEPEDGGGDAPHWEPPSFLRGAGDQPAAGISLAPLPPSDGPGSPDDIGGDQPIAVDRERFHVVESGDSLTGIAATYLGSTAAYTRIFEANRDVLSSPDKLVPGQRLRIPSGSVPRVARAVSRRPATVPPRRTRPSSSGTTRDDAASQPETFDLPPLGEGAAAEPAPAEARTRMRFVPARRSPFAPRE